MSAPISQLGRALDKAQRWDEAVQHYRRAAEEYLRPHRRASDCSTKTGAACRKIR